MGQLGLLHGDLLVSAEPLAFPEKVLDAHAALLGKTGAGKSSAMRHVVEHLLSHRKRVCIIDPKGDWWGIKSSADGKGPGFPVVTFGDFKSEEDVADVPINEESGKDLAELVTDGNRPAVIGMRGWFTAHMLKFFIDFAKGVFHGNRGEFYLFIDEVQNFAPKGSTRTIEGQGGLSRCTGVIGLLAEGRGLGINIWVGSQRPQKVHNDTLDGCETLVAMRSVHPAAREALSKWMKGAADKEKSARPGRARIDEARRGFHLVAGNRVRPGEGEVSRCSRRSTRSPRPSCKRRSTGKVMGERRPGRG
jgi:DNA helicase HerA-like ATPase